MKKNTENSSKSAAKQPALLKFVKNKTYAIGTLQKNSTIEEVPTRFSVSPVAPIYITGAELSNRNIKNVYDFLKQGCPFKVGATVYFFEVIYNEDQQQLKHFFTGTVLQAMANETLSDDDFYSSKNSNDRGVTLVQAPQDNNSKLYVKSQAELILELQKQIGSLRQEQDKERREYVKKIEELNKEKMDFNIQINTLSAELEAFRIRYDEKSSFLEQLMQRPEPEIPETPPGLADRAVGMIDGTLGDGTSQILVQHLATGLGNGISKLIEFGLSKFTTPQPQQPANIQQPVNIQPSYASVTPEVPQNFVAQDSFVSESPST